MPGLDPDFITQLLKKQPASRARKPRDPHKVRDYNTWWKLQLRIREFGCENENCVDPRPKTDKGTNICTEVQGKFICRYCYLDGYLGEGK